MNTENDRAEKACRVMFEEIAKRKAAKSDPRANDPDYDANMALHNERFPPEPRKSRKGAMASYPLIRADHAAGLDWGLLVGKYGKTAVMAALKSRGRAETLRLPCCPSPETTENQTNEGRKKASKNPNREKIQALRGLGRTQVETATELGLSLRTVKRHWKVSPLGPILRVESLNDRIGPRVSPPIPVVPEAPRPKHPHDPSPYLRFTPEDVLWRKQVRMLPHPAPWGVGPSPFRTDTKEDLEWRYPRGLHGTNTASYGYG